MANHFSLSSDAWIHMGRGNHLEPFGSLWLIDVRHLCFYFGRNFLKKSAIHISSENESLICSHRDATRQLQIHFHTERCTEFWESELSVPVLSAGSLFVSFISVKAHVWFNVYASLHYNTEMLFTIIQAFCQHCFSKWKCFDFYP